MEFKPIVIMYKHLIRRWNQLYVLPHYEYKYKDILHILCAIIIIIMTKTITPKYVGIPVIVGI